MSGSASPRPAAHHARELVGAEPAIEDMVPALSLLGEKLVRLLPAALARVSGGDPPQVRIGMPIDCRLAAIQGEIETYAAHSLLAMGPQGLPLLTTMEAPVVLRLLDRAFGGRGMVPDPLPDTLPLSAELLLARLDEAICGALGSALGGGEAHRLRPLRRDTSLRQLDPFDKRTDLLQIALDVEEGGAEAWSFALAFPQPTLTAMLATPPRARAMRAGDRAGPADEPFATLPLTVTAVLVDITLGFSRVASLRPGDVLPVPLARAVPLQVDGRTIATGTVGEVDDRVAVQIQHAF